MKLFLDDDRLPIDCAAYMHQRIGTLNPIYLQDDWTIVRTYDEFIELVSYASHDITHISFDHDLGKVLDDEENQNLNIENAPREYTGYDAAQFVKDIYKWTEEPLPIIFVHTMNPVGRSQIESLFKDNK